MADTKIVQPATEPNHVTTTQPLLNSTNIEPHQISESGTLTFSHEQEANVITTQPLMSDITEEEQNRQKQFSQFNPTINKPPPENVAPQQTSDDCTWCCFACTEGTLDCIDTIVCCADCFKCCAECCDVVRCCAGCCDGSADVDGGDVAGCLECCGACVSCCGDD